MYLLINKDLYQQLLTDEDISDNDLFYILIMVETIGFLQLDNEKDWIHLSNQYFYRLTGYTNNKIAKFIRLCESKGFIKVNHSYRVKHETKQYHTDIPCTNSVVKKHIDVLIKTKKTKNAYLNRNGYQTADNQLNTFRKIEIQKEDFIVYLKEEYGIEFDDLYNCDVIKSKRFYSDRTTFFEFNEQSFKITKGEQSNRLYTTLTKSTRKIRKLLKPKNKKDLLVQLDVSSAQPAILVGLLLQKGYEIESEIIKSFETGKFYELVFSKCGFDEERITNDENYRSEIKTKFFREIAYPKTVQALINTKNYIAINSVYPKFTKAIYDTVKEFSENSITLASQLQSLESELIQPIAQEYNCATIHDAIIYCNNKKKTINEIEKKIKNSFIEKFNFKVNVKIGGI